MLVLVVCVCVCESLSQRNQKRFTAITGKLVVLKVMLAQYSSGRGVQVLYIFLFRKSIIFL